MRAGDAREVLRHIGIFGVRVSDSGALIGLIGKPNEKGFERRESRFDRRRRERRTCPHIAGRQNRRLEAARLFNMEFPKIAPLVTLIEALDCLRRAIEGMLAPPLPEPLGRLFMNLSPALSVVVVGYNMVRELPRTIRSLSPALQRNISEQDYEILVVDNGSAARPTPEDVRGWAPNARLLAVEKPTKSPVPAINLGLREARGDVAGVLIDGACMAFPGR